MKVKINTDKLKQQNNKKKKLNLKRTISKKLSNALDRIFQVKDTQSQIDTKELGI